MKKKFEIEYEQDDAIANMIYTALAARYNIETKVTELPVAEEKCECVEFGDKTDKAVLIEVVSKLNYLVRWSKEMERRLETGSE